jgi:hypothetical protein
MEFAEDMSAEGDAHDGGRQNCRIGQPLHVLAGNPLSPATRLSAAVAGNVRAPARRGWRLAG